LSNRLLEDFSEIASDWFWEMDADLRFSYFSGPFEKVLGVSPDKELGKSRLEVAANGKDEEFWRPHIEDLLARRPFRNFVYPFRRPDGRTLWFSISGQPVFDGDGGFLGYRGVGTDITAELEARTQLAQAMDELHRSNSELEAQNLRFYMAVNNMSQGLCMFDGKRRLIVCNQRYAELYGLTPDLAQPGTTIEQIFAHRLESSDTVLDPEKFVRDFLRIIEAAQPCEALVEMRDGRIISIKHKPMQEGGWVSTHEDVTERKQAEAKIAYLARHDALTGLPNRVVFRERLEEALADARRGVGFAMLCFDLDHFKNVNDTFGHPAGDVLLAEASRRLRSCVRDCDTFARLGGDEFAILLTDTKCPEATSALAFRIIETLGTPFDIEGQQVVIGASVGIATATSDVCDADELLRNADMALYRAKEEGRNTCRFFEPEMDARQQARRRLELDLKRAFVNGEFKLVYQPIFAVPEHRVVGFEALLRWEHPERGLLTPVAFMDMCEEMGLIMPLGDWIIRQACADAATWPAPLSVAVNLSPIQFRSPNLVQAVMHALGESGLPPERLELEITESVLLLEDEGTVRGLHQFRALGARISLDDFGTGYSSLSYLRSFPFDKLKIDRSFVSDLGCKPDCLAIVRAINGLARSLGMVTLAEGVETEEQMELVIAEGCTEIQGFLLSPPRAPEELARFFAPDADFTQSPRRAAAF
jgi:diguanylate cyclase (GGDEF)-like protein/PAS domain S-box-containing protein